MSRTTETEMYQHVTQKQHSNLATTKTEKGKNRSNKQQTKQTNKITIEKHQKILESNCS